MATTAYHLLKCDMKVLFQSQAILNLKTVTNGSVTNRRSSRIDSAPNLRPY